MDLDWRPTEVEALKPDVNMEFEAEILIGQLLGLVKASNHAETEAFLRQLFGT